MTVRFLTREAQLRWLVRLVGLSLFVVLVTRLDLAQVTRLWSSISWPAWLAALTLNTAVLLASARRWQGMVRTLPEGSWFAFGPALSLFLRYYAVGLATPGRLGELARAWAVSRVTALRMGPAAAVVLLERAMDVIASLLLSAVALAVLPDPWLRPLLVTGLVGLAVAASTFALSRGALRWLLTLLREQLRRAWSSLDEELGGMPAVWRRFRGSALAMPLVWTAVTHACFMGLCVALGWGLGLPVPVIELALAATVATVIGLLPLTVAGLGTREASLIFLLAPYGVSAESALAYSLALLVVFYGGGIVPGATLWLWATRRSPQGAAPAP